MCKYRRLLGRYVDNELPGGENKFMESHIPGCAACLSELKCLNGLRQNISKNKIQLNSEFFWQVLKSRIIREEKIQNQEKEFAFDFGVWSKRLIPMPILAGILLVILANLNQEHVNPIDEYLFNNQDSSVLELMEKPGSQSELSPLLY